jgi:hypothetical protein
LITSESMASSAMRGVQLLLRERVVDARAAGERRVVRDDGFERQVFERNALLGGQRMVLGQHQHVLPFVAGQGHQLGVAVERLGGDADLGDFVDHHARHLVGRALVQAHVDLGVGLAQVGHGHRQHVARLGVGGGDGEGAAVLRAELLADALEVADLAHDQLDAGDDVLAGFGHALQALAVAREDLDAQFFLQLDDGLGHAGLRGVQRLGRLGEVQVAPHGFLNKLELMQIHIKFRLITEFIMPSESIEIAGCSGFDGNFGQQVDQFGLFAHDAGERNVDVGPGLAQCLELVRQVFAGMLAHAEEQRDHADGAGAGGDQRRRRRRQVGRGQLHVGAGHEGVGRAARTRAATASMGSRQRVARAVRQQDDASRLWLWSSRSSSQHQPAEGRERHHRIDQPGAAAVSHGDQLLRLPR